MSIGDSRVQAIDAGWIKRDCPFPDPPFLPYLDCQHVRSNDDARALNAWPIGDFCHHMGTTASNRLFPNNNCLPCL